jgi:hypothetical protein
MTKAKSKSPLKPKVDLNGAVLLLLVVIPTDPGSLPYNEDARQGSRVTTRYAASVASAFVLRWPGDLVTERACCVQRPIGMAQELACEQNGVSLAGANDRVGLLG